MRGLLAVLMLAACSSSAPTRPTPPPAPHATKVEISAVNLAGDCGPAAAPAAITVVPDKAAASSAVLPMPGSVTGPPPCEQSTLQLGIAVDLPASAATFSVQRVELLDAHDVVLGDMAARVPTIWNGTQYLDWDGKLGTAASLKVAYDLSAPPWAKLGGSRYAAQGKSLQVRVTVRIVSGSGAPVTQVVTKQTQIYVEPAVPT